MTELVRINNQYLLKIAAKTDKKNLQRFYKSQQYSACFIGFDTSYLVFHQEHIIAAAIVSYSDSENKQALLHAFVVDKRYQKQGIARELINAITGQHLASTEYSIVCFSKPELNTFYQDLSFKPLVAEKVFNTEIAPLADNQILSISLTEVNLKRFIAYQKTTPSLIAFIFTAF